MSSHGVLPRIPIQYRGRFSLTDEIAQGLPTIHRASSDRRHVGRMMKTGHRRLTTRVRRSPEHRSCRNFASLGPAY
ncbi:hypothetical protein RSSM_04108 [Rhodopirellula sallentina SM41]|uniref:Uncharacterized protein n=1 Tax=Rhodopirellula sallentina SM41 TaxID=1263870 RepID=M5UEL9_9BACT|nr:hypothetical protein RSSM_04108 [Rhodopirellula sallentina SM41]